MKDKIKQVYLCMDESGMTVGHAVETVDNVLIGTKLGATRKSMHECAKDIQKTFNMSPMQHAMLLKDVIILDENGYQELLDGFTPISFDDAKKLMEV